jgi:pre-mRNA-splicing factor CDC5/CEF1
VKEQLRLGLSSLPTPRNDYEIVVPEEEEAEPMQEEQSCEEDQADIDARIQEDQRKQSE